MSQDKIGVDQWVEQYQGRVNRKRGLTGLIERASKRLPVWAWLIIMLLIGASLPFLTSNDLVIRIAGNVALLGALALGLNVVVGYAGLLDLGFVAFYGIGAYTYAYLSSDFTQIHLTTPESLIVSTIVAGLFGLLLGLPSLRLLGDYLAIVTLGFGLIFEQIMTSMTRVNLPGQAKAIDLTGGPNGILNLDPVRVFGFTAHSVTDNYYIMLILLTVMMLVIYHLYRSRIGRAWSALREDELAAEAMGMPTRRLKIQAFATGAAIAGLCGALFASWQGSVFPNNFDTTLVITIYAIIVLGGLGSLPGVLLGALIIVAVPDVLRNADLAGKLFYLGTVVTLATALKPRWQTPLLLVAVAVFGVIVHVVMLAIPSIAWSPLAPVGAPFTDLIHSWLVAPASPITQGNAGNIGFCLLLIVGLGATKIPNKLWRFVALIPSIYLLIFVWETRLSQEPSVTRLLFVGVLLIVLMIYRPNGLLGQRRVEVV